MSAKQITSQRQLRRFVMGVRAMRATLRNPARRKEWMRRLRNRLLVTLRCVRYDHHILFIAGLPKSGTTWLSTQLGKIPGYDNVAVQDPDGLLRNHDVCDINFTSIPANQYSIAKFHTKYSPANLAVIFRHVQKFAVITRDLRDVAVSRYFHCLNDPTHRHYEMYRRISGEEGMEHSIGIIIEEYLPWVQDWRRIAGQYPDRILLLRYEDLNRQPAETFRKVCEFFSIRMPPSFFLKLAASKLEGERDLARELASGSSPGTVSTARKGEIGDFRNYFTKQHKSLIKVSMAELLIQEGYEKDTDW